MHAEQTWKGFSVNVLIHKTIMTAPPHVATHRLLQCTLPPMHLLAFKLKCHKQEKNLSQRPQTLFLVYINTNMGCFPIWELCNRAAWA